MMMKKILATILLCALSLTSQATESPASSTYHIIVNNKNSCGATAIGPHTLLTATHCVETIQTLSVIGVGIVASIDKVNDGNDHTIIRTTENFPHWLKFGNTPQQGDHVTAYHNPGTYANIYAEGYLAGWAKVNGQHGTLYTIPAWLGCSGSAILNAKGEIVGVESVIVRQLKQTDDPRMPGAAWQQIVSYDFNFTPEQLEASQH
jgi:hypothetical protein